MPDKPDELAALDWHEFPEDEGPEIQTGISSACIEGKCNLCPGHGELEGQTVFCVCDCHKLPAAA